MKNSHQLFLAFFIPFSAAVMLVTLGFYIFDRTPVDTVNNQIKSNSLTFSNCFAGKPFGVEDLYGYFIFSLFVLSAVLPVFVISRKEPVKRNELKLK